MSVNLTSILDDILYEKENKVKPEDIRYGKSMFGVKGILKPLTVDGSDTATLIYTGKDVPVQYDGVWLNTEKTFENIYIEPERYTNQYTWMVSDDTTDGDSDNTNIIKGIVAPVDLQGCTYVQRGNIVHFFGKKTENITFANEVEEEILQHYMYDFDTNTWTKLVNSPTPQGLGGAVWIGDYIYILGNVHDSYQQYCYKYNTVDDTWERILDLCSATDGTSVWNAYPVNATLGDGDNIYWSRGKVICKFDTSDYGSSVIYVPSSTYYFTYKSGNSYDKGLFMYKDAIIYTAYRGSDSYLTPYVHTYNIGTSTAGSFNATGTSSYNVPRISDGNYIYYGSRGSSNYTYVIDMVTGKGVDAKSTNTFSTDTWYKNQPIVIFTAKPYNILCCIGNPARTTAMTLNKKEYTFDNNTLIIYSTSNGTGKYRTKLFANSKILNAEKLYTAFNDIDLFEKGETGDVLTQNINTYYGNGTQWIQIK